MRFRNRKDAGQQLAAQLTKFRAESPLVLGLPRGGIPVAYEVARTLGAPLDVWVVRKVGAPGQPELGLGAVAEGGALFLDRGMLHSLGFSETEVMQTAEREADEVTARVARFRGPHPPPDLEGRTVILVDDGVATGGTVRAAIRALRERKPGRIVLAVPVGAVESLEVLRDEVDDLVTVHPAEFMMSVGEFYDDFNQTSDEEVQELLARARGQRRRDEGSPEAAMDAGDTWWV
ncbi:phosphoribosyltransferase [Vitiosangium sp. GDMCC 1.1324]|uniref:phosphoribosyltransferase n=1 Tax=Vitiosangium sp. (strain GDMCC 1.1324) TaxID=2138576 RepID=UPI000D3D8968|nr:phosphoribosyltransferase [Vitiosangium sp. GDMCC 1.1324]PTL83371.1 phosphoribosyltransferase [Vitiosangium sp. GDMCC 1.1324]